MVSDECTSHSPLATRTNSAHPRLTALRYIKRVQHAPRQHHSGLQRLQEPQLLHHEEQAPAPGARRVEEVLPALQQARRPQGNEVMAVEAAPRASLPRRVGTFYQDVRAAMARVTWPDQAQVRQLSSAVIVLSLTIGGIIAILDVLLQLIFVRGLPSLLGR